MNLHLKSKENEASSMHYETVLWDLDGTLLNTLTDLTCSANYAMF